MDFFLNRASIQVLANSLVAAVLVLTILSGLQYFLRASFFCEET